MSSNLHFLSNLIARHSNSQQVRYISPAEKYEFHFLFRVWMNINDEGGNFIRLIESIQKSKLNVPGSEIRIRDNNPDMVNLNQYRYFGAHQPRLNIVGNVTGITEL